MKTLKNLTKQLMNTSANREVYNMQDAAVEGPSAAAAESAARRVELALPTEQVQQMEKHLRVVRAARTDADKAEAGTEGQNIPPEKQAEIAALREEADHVEQEAKKESKGIFSYKESKTVSYEHYLLAKHAFASSGWGYPQIDGDLAWRGPWRVRYGDVTRT